MLNSLKDNYQVMIWKQSGPASLDASDNRAIPRVIQFYIV